MIKASILWISLVLLYCTNTISATCPDFIDQGASYTCNVITQHDITWTFAEPVQSGQFVNGDYWVVDPGGGVNITDISPGYINTPRAMNGSMINPNTAEVGYDADRNYDSSKNVGIGISATTPLVIHANDSLVSTISNEPLTYNGSYVKTAAVLTCLSHAPPTGSFRPGISGTAKTIYNVSSINKSLLKKMAVPPGVTITASTLTTYANHFKGVWLDHDTSFLARYMHPSDSGMDNYYFPITFAEAALLLHLDFTYEEKYDLLINYIQLGIDLYSYIESGMSGWGADGGNGNGRKWPILFAGVMLNDSFMKNIGQVSGDFINTGTFNADGTVTPPTGYKIFGEDGQTFFVNQYMVDITSNSLWVRDNQRVNYRNVSFDIATNAFTIAVPPAGTTIGPWNPDTRNELIPDGEGNDVLCRPYTHAMLGMPEFGITYTSRPAASDSSWTATYRSIGTGAQAWAGFVLAARVMGVKGLWNHNALFDYVDRYMEISAGRPDPFGYVVSGEFAGYRPSGFLGSMWDAYRDYMPTAPTSSLLKVNGGLRTINGRLFTLPAQ